MSISVDLPFHHVIMTKPARPTAGHLAQVTRCLHILEPDGSKPWSMGWANHGILMVFTSQVFKGLLMFAVDFP